MSQFADPEGRYRLDSRIATGGMGVVWRGTDTRLDRPVAVKVLKLEYADDPLFRSRFEAEARSAGALHHPGIAGVYDYGTDERSSDAGGLPPYLVMELVDGQPLSALLANAKANDRTLDVGVVQDLMGQAAEALGVAHRAGIVHRDVKPANLLVTPDRIIKITDFGIARAMDAVALTRTGSVMGTPQYLSPEQARGNPSTPASDVYSLGVVAFECLTGRRAFEAETPVATALAHLQQPVPELPADIPAPLAAVVRKAMAKDPSERYADGAAFAAALRDPSGVGPATQRVAPVPAPDADDSATRVLPPLGAAAAVAAPGAREPIERLGAPAAYAGDEDQARRSPWPTVIGVIVAVLAIALIAFLVINGNDDKEPVVADPTSEATPTTESAPTEETSATETTEPTQETSTADPVIRVDPADYVGRNYEYVQAELEDLGLDVRIQEDPNSGSESPGLVSRLSTSGSLQKGDDITVYYWGPAPQTSSPPPSDPTTEATDDLPVDPSDLISGGDEQ